VIWTGLRNLSLSANMEGLGRTLLNEGKDVDTGHWQSLEGVPHVKTRELQNVAVEYQVPYSQSQLAAEVHANQPWAEDHFLERVGGEPLNPGEQFKNWPWYRGGVEDHKAQGQFSHTYMERYWPKGAGSDGLGGHQTEETREGIRYPYGDLFDVVQLLAKYPGTRQAYLPVWFPEDTGAVHGERVPCSIGYHFLWRGNKLYCNYYMRSCDFLRYLKDDIYLTCRLMQWVCQQLSNFKEVGEHAPIPGELTMLIGSLHIFEGDLPKMERLYATPLTG
jgi:Thymidylate synthase